MADIAKYLEDLKSPNPNKRFDACYYLRRMKEIPESAILALQEAINDSDALVAKEARNALEVHQQSSTPILTPSAPPASKNNAGIVVGVIIIIIVFLCVVDFSNSSFESGERMGNLMMAAVVLGPFYLIPLIIVISIIAIGKKNSNIKLQEKINGSANSGSGLSRFTEKTDFTNLKGEPKDFYEAGVVFVEKGQFDDGIMEFVKVIKTASLEDNLYVLAQKELENMGFSKMDIENARQTKNA